MTRWVDSDEKTLHTTSSNECKFLWNSNSRRKTIAEKTSLTITSSFRESLNWKASPSSCFWVSFVGCLEQCSVLFIKTTYSREPRHCGVQLHCQALFGKISTNSPTGPGRRRKLSLTLYTLAVSGAYSPPPCLFFLEHGRPLFIILLFPH